MNKWFEIFVGLVLLIISALVWGLTLNQGFWNFGTAAWEFFKGGLIWFIILIGLLFVVLGISDLKE